MRRTRDGDGSGPLVRRPGAVARDFIEERRQRYFGPFAFLVVCVAVATAAIALSGFPVVPTVPGWYLIARNAVLAQRLYYGMLPIWPGYFAFACAQFFTGRRWISAIKGILAIALAVGGLQVITNAVSLMVGD